MEEPVKRRRGRGARERILAAAAERFTADGINATRMDRIAEVASVSKRTLYVHFPTKDDLVTAYLAHMADGRTGEAAVDDDTLPPRERLLALFAPRARGFDPIRGCPFLGAAVEVPDPDHPAHAFVREHKLAFAARLAALAREAGAADPELLGAQLALLYDGAASRAVALDDVSPGDTARGMATALVDAALAGRTVPGNL